MKFPQFFLFTLLLVSFILLFNYCSTPTVEKKPNIIFIMSDDHAFQAISAYDTTLITTPNIDKLAEEGMIFERAYVTNSICSPSRAVILTGKHSHLNGLKNNIDVFDSTQQTFPKLLQQAGYETAVVGKWHLKSEPTGFNFWKVLPGQGNYYKPDFKTQEGIVTEEGYVTDIITDNSIDWLKSRQDPEQPFMLMVHHKAPHREWWPPMESLGMFMDTLFPEPKSLFDDYMGRGRAAKDAEMRISDHMGYSNDNKIHPDSVAKMGLQEFIKWYHWAYRNSYGRMTKEEQNKWDSIYNPVILDLMKNTPQDDELVRWKYQRYMQDYLACIKSVDENVGRLLNYLDESGLAENTLVIYTSDQGFYLGEHGWFDKRFMYEESFRTPLLMKWPDKIKAGSVNSKLVQNLDIAETILDAAGVTIPEDMQGKSLLPLFDGKEDSWRESLYYHYYEYPGIHGVKRHYGISTERYKLIHFYYDIDDWEMYDLKIDPGEMNNIYNDHKYNQVRKDMHAHLKELRKQYGDSDSLTQEILQHDLMEHR